MDGGDATTAQGRHDEIVCAAAATGSRGRQLGNRTGLSDDYLNRAIGDQGHLAIRVGEHPGAASAGRSASALWFSGFENHRSLGLERGTARGPCGVGVE